MAQNLAGTGRLLVRKIFLYQCITALISALICLLIWNQQQAVSILVGGLICTFSHFIFGLMAFRYAGGSKNKQVVKSFNQGLKLKLALSIIFFVVAFQWLKLPFLPLLAGYFLTQISQWFCIAYSSHES
ncbi:ATP synthase subunit I [Neptunicella sp.]|uniref:ATP synthase subunit I n=1 Tax=Neptunicella sp. TaxID=2125986 RepID=UPI003F690AE5